MKTFTKGFAAGVSALAIGVPMFAQMTLAASGDQASSKAAVAAAARPVPSQACLLAMATLEDAHLANIDTEIGTRKTRMQAHAAALRSAAAIADDAARQEALKAAHEDMKPDTKPEMPAAITAAMEAVKTACGDTMMGRGKHRGGPGGGFMGKPFMMKFRDGEAHAEPKPMDDEEQETSVAS